METKQFNFTNVNGITENQLAEHYKLYEGYVAKVNSISAMLKSSVELGVPNLTESYVRNLKKGESYAYNGVRLHELYYENLINRPTQPSESINYYIEKDYGNMENLLKRMKDVGLSVKGWVILRPDLPVFPGGTRNARRGSGTGTRRA